MDNEQLRSRLKAAVEAQAIPVELRARVRQRLDERQPSKWWGMTWIHWVVAAAALVVCVGVLMTSREEPLPGLTDRKAQDAFIQKVSRRVAVVLRSGLGDHIHCAVFRKYPKTPPSVEQMAASLGPDFKALLPVVQAAAPPGYRVIMAHRCGYAGRKYTHLTLGNGSSLISLVVARKNPGESAEGMAPSARPAGMRIYQAGAERFEVAGFEADQYLVFIVSDLRGSANLQVAANLAPAVRDVLLLLNRRPKTAQAYPTSRPA